MITSITNNRIKRIRLLQDKSKLRDQEQVLIAEGANMFLEAPKERIQEVYITEEFLRKAGQEREVYEGICDRLMSTSYEIVSEEVFGKISDTQTPQGILCVVEQKSYDMEEIIRNAVANPQKAPLFLILEDIQDPGNLGTMIRTGEGAGVDGVFMNRDTVSIYNPKSIRSTMGSIYRVPFFYTDDLRDVITKLKQNNIPIYAAHLKGKLYYDEVDYSSGSAFLIGNEGKGLKKETAVCADTVIRIPMKGQIESLNAAIAASLLMYRAAYYKS